jgi:two-component sensor histidine kinase
MADSFLLRLPAFRNVVHGNTIAGMVAGQAAAIGIAAFALLARFLLDPYLPPGFPYLTFFPAVVITGFVWGIYPAITSGILSGLAAWYWFIPPRVGFVIDSQALTALVFYLVVITIDLGLLQLALYALRSQVKAQQALSDALQLQKVVSDEVDHRLKNLLATVSGLISLSQKHAATPAELADQLRKRIVAMNNSVALLRGVVHGEQASIRAAILAALEPLGISDGQRLTLEGPNLILGANGIIPLNLILHELATNALKYGALSNQAGTVLVEWTLVPSDEGNPLFHLVWTERLGPPTTAPSRSGFGTELLNRMSRTLGGGCSFDFDSAGLTARMTMDSERILDTARD